MRPTQTYQSFHLVINRIFVRYALFDRRTVFIGVYRNIELFGRRKSEARIYRPVPLHRRAGACSSVAAFNGNKIFNKSHSDFVAVIDKRHTGHRKDERKHQLYCRFVVRQSKTLGIVIAGIYACEKAYCCLWCRCYSYSY